MKYRAGYEGAGRGAGPIVRARELTIEGEPVPKGRPRCGKGRVRSPDATKEAERAVAWLWKDAHRDDPLDGPLRVELWFWTASAVKDADNLAKLVLDALNGVAWWDDRQVESLEVWVRRKFLARQTFIRVERMRDYYDRIGWS